MSDQSLNRPSSSVVLAALVVLTGTGFFVVDRIPAQLGGLGQLWILAIVVGAGGSAAAWALARGRFAGGASGSLAIVLLAYLAIHAMLVGVGYLAAVGWAKLALPVALFVTAVLDEPARRRSVVVQALTAVTLLSALAAFGELVDPAPMPRSWVDPSRYQAVRVRVTAMFANPNVYGAYLALVLPLHVGQYLSAAAGVPAVVSGWAAGLSLVLLLCTFSRGAWLGALVGLAALGLLARSRRLDGPSPGRLLVLGLALTMGVAAVAPGLVERVKVTGDREELGRAQRRELFRGVVAGIAARPMLGWGQNGFDTHYPRSRTQGGYYPREAHSSYLHLAFEAGLPALALYVALLVAALVSVRRDEPTDWVRVGAGASVVAGLTACLTATGLAYLQLDLPFWAVVLAWHSGSCQAPPGSWGSVLGRVVAAPVALTSALWIGVAVVDTTWRRDQSPERLATATRLMWFREDLWNDLGEGLELQGDLEAARKAYTRGLDVNPDQTRLRSSRARCRAKRGDLAGALADLEAALAADPRSEELLLNKALILLALRRPAGAIASLEMALETNQQYLSLNPDTYRRAAELLADLHGRAGEARKAARARQLAQQLAR